MYFEFSHPWTRHLLKLIDSGIHFEMQKEKLISSGVEWKPLVTLFFLTQFQNLFFRIVFCTFFGQLEKCIILSEKKQPLALYLIKKRPKYILKLCMCIYFVLLLFRHFGIQLPRHDFYMQNYVSIGVDALVTYNFHKARESPFYLISSRIINKLIYFRWVIFL